MKRIRKGIYAYESGKPKRLVSLYISYKDEYGKSKKEKVNTLLPDEATILLEDKKAAILKLKRNMKDDKTDFLMGRATIDQIAKEFFDNRTTANNKKDQQRYENHIQGTFGTKTTSRVKEDDVIAWRDDLGVSANKTKNDILSILKMLLPKDHKVQNIEKLTVDKNLQKGRVMTDEELEIFFDAIMDKPQLNLFCRLCYFTGARPQAILELTPNHFLDESVHIKAMKGADSYDVPLKDDLLDLSDDWIEDNELDDDDALFFGEQNIQRGRFSKSKVVDYSVMGKRVRDVCNPLFNLTRRGKPITDKTKRVSIYTLRRTAATNIAKKVSLVAAQKFLNHQDPKTTMKYIGLDDADVREAINVL